MLSRLALAVVCTFACVSAGAAECTAQTGDRRVPLLELYTSEGCDSCPPTDRWVSELPRRGYGTNRVVVLSYHVDYWDRLGWPDRFAQARFSERQRLINHRNGARFVYTPQLMLNGKDFRRGAFRDDFGEALARSSTPAGAHLKLAAAVAKGELVVSATSSVSNGAPAQVWLAVYENGLASDVRAGENRGKRLQHDFVVRELAGPFAVGPLRHAIKLNAEWKEPNLGIAAIVSDTRSGEALQALALPLCK